MLISLTKNNSKSLLFDNKLIFLGSIALAVFITLIFRQFGVNHITLGIIMVLPVAGLFLFSFDTFLVIFILAMFINLEALMFKVAELLVIPFLLSYIITSKKLEFKSLRNPLTLPFFIYLITMIPSLSNSINVPLSIYLMYNFIAMVIVFHIVAERIEQKESLSRYLYIFLAMCFLNSLVIFIQYFTTGGRVFGFTGVVFVDYSALAVLISVIFILIGNGKNKLVFLFLALFILAALIMTETRNTLLSLGASFFTLILYLIKENKLFSINRRKVITYFIAVIVITIFAVIGLMVYAPQIFNRFTNLTAFSKMFVIEKNKIGVNSTFVTRVLIWLTALNAFVKHPIIGIGAFSFPFSSYLYYTIPPILFKAFVEGLSTHVTFFSTLTETGIIGTIGFLVFLISSLRIGFKSVKIAITYDERLISAVILFMQIYIFYSMFMTDAWLWGQCGMLWGFVLGLSLANYKILLKKAIQQNVQR